MEAKDGLKILGGLAIVTTLFAFKKKRDYSEVIEQMTIDLRDIRDLQLKGSKMYVTLDIGFHNPTKYDMTVYTAGMITVRKIELFYKGLSVGAAYSNTQKFDLPAKSNFLITDVKLELLYLNLIEQWLKSGLDADVNNYQIHITIEALGKTWIIEQ